LDEGYRFLQKNQTPSFAGDAGVTPASLPKLVLVVDSLNSKAPILPVRDADLGLSLLTILPFIAGDAGAKPAPLHQKKHDLWRVV
jgi:hypothetical protein